MNKLIFNDVSQIISGYYRHAYFVFETYPLYNERQGGELQEGTVLPYKYQCNSSCLLSLYDDIRHEILTAAANMMSALKNACYYLLKGEANYPVLCIVEETEQLLDLYYRYITKYVVGWITEPRWGQSPTSHNIIEYLNHFGLLTKDVTERVTDLITKLERTSRTNKKAHKSSETTEMLRGCLQHLQVMLARTMRKITDAEAEMQDPTNKIILN